MRSLCWREATVVFFDKPNSINDVEFKIRYFKPTKRLKAKVFSQIKTLLIELQTLQVSDVTDSNVIMFKMKDILNNSGNMSGNLSGNWDDTRNMSRRDNG